MGESPKVNPENLLEIVKGAYQGKVVLPEFQRSFVWEREDIEEFLASILQGYFVGTFLMLDTSPDSPLFPFRPVEGLAQVNGQANPKEHSTVRLVLDGQQRITSVFYALYAPAIPLRNSKHPYKFYLRLKPMLEEDFDEAIVGVSTWDKRQLSENEALVSQHRALPFTLLADSGAFRRWLFKEQQVWGEDEQTRFDEFYSRFEKFMVPVVNLSSNTNKDNIVNIFERINRTGVSLSLFDLAVARLYPKEVKLRELWEQFKKEHPGVAGLIKPEFLLKVIAVFQGKEPRKGNLLDVLDGLTAEEFLERWREAAEAIVLAHERVREEYGALEPGWIPYTTLLVPLGALLWKLKRDKAGQAAYENVDAWYWGSVFAQRYDSAVDSKTYRDFGEVSRWIEGGDPPEWLRRLDPQSLNLDVDEPRSAVYKGLMCLIARRGARDFLTGQLANLNECQDDHIFPKAVYQKDHRVDSVFNRTLISKETNNRKGDKRPSEFLQECLEGHAHNHEKLQATLDSHYILPDAYEALCRDDFEAFVKARGGALREAIAQLLNPSRARRSVGGVS
ncbi:hypothetical protein QT17_05265 [Thermus sp. 2.9]|uniref:GmrSD restriction endonuclease domain-containing protein n=1 Tax=Thermus sp. (strain 2.9) TaxID=1577051 RepID=UPI00054434D5|nr:DUF262 domain-containing protein [Thermus sp. 2.9]KHG65684.1 hypothetical protein QT17_05265 [Thermus sp. 2.9]